MKRPMHVGIRAIIPIIRRGMVPVGEVSDVIAHDMKGATELRTAYESLRKEKLVAQPAAQDADRCCSLHGTPHTCGVGPAAPERDETWWRARAEREEGHLIAAGALSMVPDAVKGEEVLVDPHDDLCDHGLHLEDSCAQCQSEMRAIDSLMEEQ